VEERILVAGRTTWNLRVRPGAAEPPLLLLHGFASDGRLWEPVVSGLPDTSLLIPDLPGHGHSAQPPVRWGLEDLADALAELLEACGAPVTDVCGYSMGGRAALAFASRHPSRVRRLILISASPGIEEDGDRRGRAESDETLACLLEEKGIRAFVDRWESLPLFETERALPQATRLWLRKIRLEQDAQGLAAALRAFGTGRMVPLWERLPHLTMPVLLAAGELDPKYAVLTARMGTAVPGSHVELIPRAGHLLPLEAPESLAAAIRRVLA
jgi:2-succinyl-6-hydroxy-2,4-cyclohexadiene-1-carboxylate synthase